MLSIAEVTDFLQTPKQSVSGVTWREGMLKDTAQWWKWDCAIELDGFVPEGARVILQWRPETGAAYEKFSCGLLFQNLRVYAIDFDPDTKHTNKVGFERPHYQKQFGPGTHVHTWSTEGYGYAEPMDDFNSFASLFAFFCEKANLSVAGGFKNPPSQQYTLNLL